MDEQSISYLSRENKRLESKISYLSKENKRLERDLIKVIRDYKRLYKAHKESRSENLKLKKKLAAPEGRRLSRRWKVQSNQYPHDTPIR